MDIFLFSKKLINDISNNEGMSELIMISKKEYDGMKETIEILQNPEMMKQILESEENRKKGIKFKKLNKNRSPL